MFPQEFFIARLDSKFNEVITQYRLSKSEVDRSNYSWMDGVTGLMLLIGKLIQVHKLSDAGTHYRGGWLFFPQ